MRPPDPDPCAGKRLLIQAEIDGELDTAEAARIATHRATCPACAAAHARLLALRRELRQTLQPYEAPAALRERITASLQPSPVAVMRPRQRPRLWRNTGAGFGALAIAASLLLLLRSPAPELGDLVLAGHLRALQPGHLMDVVSTDQHNVKPWFDGRIDFAPPVRNLAGIGFPLEGGRLDYIHGRAVAALVYKSRQHVIDLYTWPDTAANDSAPRLEIRNGYNLYHWTEGGMSLWAVSDLNAAELGGFVKNWRGER